MPLENNNIWNSRIVYITVLICQFIGISNINSIPNNALNQGTTGYAIILILLYLFLGIPMLYMESVVGQFTTRNCVDVWKIRPCFSYMGYVVIVWQTAILFYNHVITSFLVHYFLISFEKPIPFYTCGSWSTKYCNSLRTNYTVNLDCIKYQNLYPYCEQLYKTFPEYQYWRYYLVRNKENREYYVAWRVCLASGLICFVLFLSSFKRSKSLKWIVVALTFYAMLSLMIMLTGSMRQKGVVAKYEESLDLDFSDFVVKFRLSHIIQQVVYNLNIGTGTTYTLASTLPFRSPCFSDIVISVVICTVFTVIFIYTTAMMTCPYSYEYGIHTRDIIKTPISLNFEKIPRLLNFYQHNTFYLIVVFSCEAITGISTMVIFLFNLFEVIFNRYPKLAKYPGVMAFCAVVLLFFLTIPFLSYFGVNVVAVNFRRYVTIFSTLIGILECFVFVIWYGVNRFSEDIHFMLGIQPRSFVKATWILSFILLIYAFIFELYSQFASQIGYMYATYLVIALVVLLVTILLIRLLVSICKKKFRKFILLEPTWGPNSDVLQRSRAMFTAQAMTKEYIYRQYHLQAGIIARQQRANKIICR